MQWSEVPAELERYDSLTYSDDTRGTSASEKLIRYFTEGRSASLADVPEHRRDEFIEQLQHRVSACDNLDKSVAWRPTPGKWP